MLHDNHTILHCRVIGESVLFFVLSAACGCHPVGSVALQCVAYGGQCPCRPGVVGRTCNSCDTSFYGFSLSGCKRKNATYHFNRKHLGSYTNKSRSLGD